MHGREAGHCARAYLLCELIILWLTGWVEVQQGVGAQADGADSWVVKWPIFMGLDESRYQNGTGQESMTPPSGMMWDLPGLGRTRDRMRVGRI